MGRDKAGIELHGQTLLERVVGQVSPHVAEVIVSTSARGRHEGAGWRVVPDREVGQGPLMALSSALTASSSDYNLVIACDVPRLPAGLVGRLLAAAAGADGAVVVGPDGRWEPLLAVYHRRIVPRLERLLADGERQALRLFDVCELRAVELPEGVVLENLNTPEEVAAHLHGDLVDFETARERIVGSVQPLAAQSLALADALGCVATETVVAEVDVPAEARSAMDGFAVRAADPAPAAVRVPTGAPLPDGADAVVEAEAARVEDGVVFAARPLSGGDNVLAPGHDLPAGTVLVREGEVLTTGRAVLLAAAGVAAVRVVPRAHVAAVSVGDELVRPGQPLGQGDVHLCNDLVAKQWLGAAGLDVTAGLAPDEAEGLRRVLSEALAGADALVTSGGTWLGSRDRTVGVLEGLGVRMHLHGVRVSPGKTMAFGTLGAKPVFCLPGGPAAHAATLVTLARPALRRLAGRAGERSPSIRARLTEPVRGREGWTRLVAVRLEPRGQWPEATPLLDASRLLAVSQADGYVVAGPSGLHRGAGVEVIPVGGSE